MSEFKLLRPEEVISNWQRLSSLLAAAVDKGNGELEVDDIKKLVIGGRMFIFADDDFALTCEFVNYPRKTVMVAGFGSGKVHDFNNVIEVIYGFARRGGASSIQTYVREPSMVRYYKRLLKIDPLYAVLEKSL